LSCPAQQNDILKYGPHRDSSCTELGNNASLSPVIRPNTSDRLKYGLNKMEDLDDTTIKDDGTIKLGVSLDLEWRDYTHRQIKGQKEHHQ
jgi:hypothetical protein